MKKNQSYQFTLILKGANESTPNIEDSLYEAGCNDALINFKNNTVFLDFDRKAKSLKEAIISAIKQVEASSVKATVRSVIPKEEVNRVIIENLNAALKERDKSSN